MGSEVEFTLYFFSIFSMAGKTFATKNIADL